MDFVGAAMPPGWMEPETFLAFLKHLVKTTKPSKENPVLLLLDNNYSHLAIEVIDYNIENGIVLLYFPPHCSHKLQPLDRTVYGTLKQLMVPIQVAWMRSNPGKTMTIYDLPGIIRQACGHATFNITSGFAVTGIYLFDRNIFLMKISLRMSQTGQTLKWIN